MKGESIILEHEYQIPRNVKTGFRVMGMDKWGLVYFLLTNLFLIPFWFFGILYPIELVFQLYIPFPIKTLIALGASIAPTWALFYQDVDSGDMHIELLFSAICGATNQYGQMKGTLHFWGGDEDDPHENARKTKAIQIQTRVQKGD